MIKASEKPKRQAVDGGKDGDPRSSELKSDASFSSCSATEEESNVPKEKMFYYRLLPGSMVWARQSGYPWWPAIVERDPNTKEYLEFRTKSDLIPYKCHVTYFGEPVTRAWVFCSKVKAYSELSEKKLFTIGKKGLKDSICSAREALQLSLKERLVKFGFHSRFVSDRESSEDSDIAEMFEQIFGKAGNDCNNEGSWSKQQRSIERKQKERKRERSRRVTVDKVYRAGDNKSRKMKKKKLKERNEGEKERKGHKKR